MSEERFDFSAFDLDQDRERFERIVGNIMWRSRGELARRASHRASPLETLAAWFRPALVAAASIAAVSLTLLASGGNGEPDVATGAYMSSAEVPAAMTAWYEEDVVPSASELLVATNEGGN